MSNGPVHSWRCEETPFTARRPPPPGGCLFTAGGVRRRRSQQPRGEEERAREATQRGKEGHPVVNQVLRLWVRYRGGRGWVRVLFPW